MWIAWKGSRYKAHWQSMNVTQLNKPNDHIRGCIMRLTDDKQVSIFKQYFIW